MIEDLKDLSERKAEPVKIKVEPGNVERPSTIELQDRLVEAHRRTAWAFLRGWMPAYLYFTQQAL